MKQKIDTVIVVLGSPNDDDGTLSSIAKSRCEQAAQLFKTLETTKESCAVLPTGGVGEHFNRTDTAHAIYTKQYMIQLGIPTDVFLEAALSQHTVEDAIFSHDILKNFEVATLHVVTSDFHIERAEFIFQEIYGSTQNIVMVPATLNLSVEERSKLRAHEKQALASLKKNGIMYERL